MSVLFGLRALESTEMLKLPKRDREIVRRCLVAAARGLYGEDLHAVVGLHQPELEALLQKWPTVEDDPNWEFAVNNALLNAWGYPLDDDTVRSWFGVSRDEIRRVHHKWKHSRGERAASH
jgi:hypothetical protein